MVQAMFYGAAGGDEVFEHLHGWVLTCVCGESVLAKLWKCINCRSTGEVVFRFIPSAWAFLPVGRSQMRP